MCSKVMKAVLNWHVFFRFFVLLGPALQVISALQVMAFGILFPEAFLSKSQGFGSHCCSPWFSKGFGPHASEQQRLNPNRSTSKKSNIEIHHRKSTYTSAK